LTSDETEELEFVIDGMLAGHAANPASPAHSERWYTVKKNHFRAIFGPEREDSILITAAHALGALSLTRA